MAEHEGGGLPGMAAQLRRLQEELKSAQEKLSEETVEASAGGGAVRILMSGTQECREVHIAPRLLGDAGAVELPELIRLAVNQAIHDSQALAARRLGPLAAGRGT